MFRGYKLSRMVGFRAASDDFAGISTVFIEVLLLLQCQVPNVRTSAGVNIIIPTMKTVSVIFIDRSTQQSIATMFNKNGL